MRHFFMMLCLVFSASIIYAQQLDRPIYKNGPKYKHKHVHSHKHDHSGYEQHDHSLDGVERTPSGHIRCYHMEADAKLRAKYPEKETLEEFEKWLAPRVEAWKAQNAQKSMLPILTIPVVFHVITDGTAPTNVSAALIQAQIDQLNIDFRNLAGSTDPVAADVEIEFCLAQLDPSNNVMPEPGIDRVTTYGAGSFSDTYIDNTVKPATIWNPDDYLNIWLADITGGILGWAQFPTSSGLAGMPTGTTPGEELTDGVVVLYSSVGSIANPNPAGGAYNKGRTLTHEIGHWVGLRHIWGDGGCTQDDYCNDTPDSDASNFGCPNVTNCGSVDMVENYMDYTDDNCMNIFTADQKARIRTVMSVSPRRMSLPNSTKCIVSDYSIAAVDSTLEICPPANAVYTINIGEFGGYADPVSLSVTGVPAGATATFGSTTVTPVGSTTLTISGLGAVAAGTYNITVNANSTSGAQSLPLVLVVSDPVPTTAVTLTSPANAATGVAVPTVFDWGASASAGAVYDIEIATDAGFSNIVETATGLTSNSYTSATLSSNTTYYWRVTVSTACGVGPTSSVSSFTTSNCALYVSTDVPVAIAASGAPTITSVINITTAGTVTDLNIAQLDITHTWVGDLSATLTSPSGTTVQLFDAPGIPASQYGCGDDDISVSFDDAAANTAADFENTCNAGSPAISGAYQSIDPLSAFNGEPVTGTWTLTISDAADPDGGSLTAWSIEACVQPPSNLDASISDIINPTTTPVCDNPFTPEVELSNEGVATLTSVNINYQIDAGPVQTFNWTGSLAPGAATTVVLNPITAPAVGTPFTFQAYTSAPNGGVDGNLLNDTSSVDTEIDVAATLPYAEPFDAGNQPGDITIFNPNGDAAEWAYTTTASNSGGGPNRGSMLMDNFNNNSAGTLDWIILPTFDLTGKAGVIMTFDVAYARYDATYSDTLTVAVNDDCGTQYGIEYTKGGSDLATAPDETALFVPGNNEWRTDTVDLSAYDGMPRVRVALINVGGYGNAMYIDNINIVATSTCTIASSISSQTDVDCNGASTGSATVTATAGTTPYTYIWTSGATTATANNLAAGVYTVTVEDAAACQSVQTVTITEPSALTSSATSTNVACNGGNDGTITVTASGGTSGYQYNIGSGSQASGSFTGLSAGNYIVTISDANGCTTTESVAITEPNALSASISSQTNVACNGGNTGAVTVAATGGTSGYQYNIGSGNQASGSFTGLSAGNYTVTITDANGCTTTQAVNITQPASALSASTTSTTDVVCNGDNTGSFTVAAAGGTSPYQYNIGGANQGTGTFSNLTAGTYTVNITDANGCTTTQSVTINEPTAISATISSTGESCAGNDGTATVNVSGGAGSYTYLWNTGATTASVNALAAGSYTVTIEDANGCTNVRSVVVANVCNPCSVASTVNSSDVNCNAACDGSITITPTGGTAPYTYTWGDGASGGMRSNLCAGTYTVTIVDNGGCTGSQSVTINEPTALTSSASNSSTTCVANSGTATATAAGGTAPYSYSWSTGGNTATISNLAGNATYTVTVMDANGCESTASTTIAAIPTGPSVSATGTDLLCNGDATGDATANLSGGTAPFTYDWSNGGNTATISNLAAGSYSVTVTDANGCSGSASLSLTEPTALSGSASGNNPSCNGDANGDANVTVTGGTAPYIYNWSNGSTVANASNLAAGSYTVTVTDANGCATTSSVALTEPAALTSSATGTNPTSTTNNDGAINLTVNGGTAPYTYDWSDGSTNEDPTGLAAGTYDVTVTDANGCTSNASVTLTVPSAIDEPELVESFAIMPNPNTGQFVVQIELAAAQDARVELVDVLGRNLREWNFGAQQQITIPVDISNQAGGMYLLILRTEDGQMQTRKVTVGK